MTLSLGKEVNFSIPLFQQRENVREKCARKSKRKKERQTERKKERKNQKGKKSECKSVRERGVKNDSLNVENMNSCIADLRLKTFILIPN